MAKKLLLKIDSILENFAITALVSMILIVCMQVFTRKFFNFVFFWSEEITLLLLVWFGFMGIAIGFREGLHLAMDSITEYLPKKVNYVLDGLINVSSFVFGIYLIVQGWDFTILMAESTLAATKLPNSTLYIVMPLSGIMICFYAALQFFGIDTKRHSNLDEGAD